MRRPGSRSHASYYRPAGVRQDLQPSLIAHIADWCDHFPMMVDDIERLVTDNRAFKQRNVDVGNVPKDGAFAWGLSGALLRGSAVAWDLRRNQPFAVLGSLTSCSARST